VGGVKRALARRRRLTIGLWKRCAKRLEAFDYGDVRLLPSRCTRQIETAREYYMAIPNADILHGFRQAAGLTAPGKPLGGWCRETSATVFRQWLSGMARLSRATGDTALRDKASYLLAE